MLCFCFFLSSLSFLILCNCCLFSLPFFFPLRPPPTGYQKVNIGTFKKKNNYFLFLFKATQEACWWHHSILACDDVIWLLKRSHCADLHMCSEWLTQSVWSGERGELHGGELWPLKGSRGGAQTGKQTLGCPDAKAILGLFQFYLANISTIFPHHSCFPFGPNQVKFTQHLIAKASQRASQAHGWQIMSF